MSLPETYLDDGGWAQVPGATGPENLRLIYSCGRLQEEWGIRGDVAEIGVYLGRAFIVLLLLARRSENALAIDVFDDTDKNFDVTGGAPALIAFKESVRQNVPGAALARLRIVTGDSFYLAPSDLRAHMACERIRILSIDGAHSWYHTLADLRLADALVQRGGIVIVDDITNPGWPGVMDGVARFLLSGSRRLFPFAIGRNKLWLTTPEYHERYLNHFISEANPIEPPFQKRVSEFFGTKVVGF